VCFQEEERLVVEWRLQYIVHPHHALCYTLYCLARAILFSRHVIAKLRVLIHSRQYCTRRMQEPTRHRLESLHNLINISATNPIFSLPQQTMQSRTQSTRMCRYTINTFSPSCTCVYKIIQCCARALIFSLTAPYSGLNICLVLL